MKHVFPFLILLTLTAKCFSQTPDCIVNGFEIYADPANEVVLDGNLNPDPCLLHENRVNLVILPDGYTVNGTDFDQYRSQKDAFLDQLFTNPFAAPFPQYRSYFNVYWVWVASTDEGIGCKHTTDPGPPPTTDCEDHICTAPTWEWVSCLGESDTYFKFKRDGEGFHRFILSDDSEAILSAVQEDMFDNTTAPLTIAVMGNSLGTTETHKGGGAEQYVSGDVGIFCATSGSNQSNYPDQNPNNNAALEVAGNVAVHELAHTFANLLDEYWFDVTTIGLSPDAYNQSTNGNASDPNHPWAVWMIMSSLISPSLM